MLKSEGKGDDLVLPVLNTEPTYLETNVSNTKLSPLSTKNYKSGITKASRASYNKLFTLKEEERIYKLSEIEKVKKERSSIEKGEKNESFLKVKRIWDVYPSKENVLQDIRRQFSSYLIQGEEEEKNRCSTLPSITKSQSQEYYIYINYSQILVEAGKIYKERLKHSKIAATSLKVRSKKDMMDEHYSISHKNYIIKILKEERSNLNGREQHIIESLKSCETDLNIDEIGFNNCKEADQFLYKRQELVR